MVLLRDLFRSIVRTGTLRLIEPDGRVHRIGSGGPSVSMRILDGAVIPRLLADPDLAFGEAYMDGAIVIEDGDIYDLLDLCFRNLGWRR